jgi:MFS family permease
VEKMSRNWLNRNVLSLGFARLFSDLSHESVTAVLPAFLSAELGVAAFILGLIEGISDISSSFIKMFSGWYSDKTGKRKPLVLLGYILTGIFVPAIGFASHWIHVLIARTFGWIGRGVRRAPQDALLSDSVNKKYRSMAFGFDRMMDTTGAILGPAITFIFLPLLGFRNLFLLSFIPGILAVLAAFLVKEKFRKPNHKIRFVKTVRKMPNNFKKFLVAVAIFGIANFANTFLILRVSEALRPAMGAIAAGSIATGLYVLLNLGGAIFSYVSGILGNRFNKRYLLALGYFIFALYCIGFIVLEPTITNFALLFILAGIEMGLIDVMEGAYTADILKSSIRGTGYGILHTINGIGDFLSSTIAGLLWTLFSFNFAFAYGATLSTVAAIILVVMGDKESKIKKVI